MESPRWTRLMEGLKEAQNQLASHGVAVAKSCTGSDSRFWNLYMSEMEKLAEELPSFPGIVNRLASDEQLAAALRIGGTDLVSTLEEQLSRLLEDYTQAIAPRWSLEPPARDEAPLPGTMTSRALGVKNVKHLFMTVFDFAAEDEAGRTEPIEDKIWYHHRHFRSAAITCDRCWAHCEAPWRHDQPSADHATSDHESVAPSESVCGSSFSLVDTNPNSTPELIDAPTEDGHEETESKPYTAEVVDTSVNDQMQNAAAAANLVVLSRSDTPTIPCPDGQNSDDGGTATAYGPSEIEIPEPTTSVAFPSGLSVILDKPFTVFLSTNLAIAQCVVKTATGSHAVFCLERIIAGNDSTPSSPQVMVLMEPCRDGPCEHTSIKGLGDSYLGPDGGIERPKAWVTHIRYSWEDDYIREASAASRPVLIEKCNRRCSHTVVEFGDLSQAVCMVPIHLRAIQVVERRWSGEFWSGEFSSDQGPPTCHEGSL